MRHLRLHQEGGQVRSRTAIDLPAWEDLQLAYQGLTGWKLDCRPGKLPPRAESLSPIPHLFGGEVGQLFRQRVEQPTAMEMSDQHAEVLAQAIAGIFVELQATRGALREREAELAAAVPVIARRHEGADFDHRLQAILRGTVEGLKGQATALYVLDDATSELKLRSHWGLPSLRFLEPARQLRGAVADLEALTGHAVVLEDTRQFKHWNVPEAFASAVCVPVSSPDALLGTFWFFSDQVRDYSPQETQLLEIIAGRLAVELERRVLVQEAARNAQHRDQAEELLDWQRERSRPVVPMVDGWQVASATVRDGQLCGDFTAWHVDLHDRLLLCSSSISGSSARSALSGTLFQGAAQATLRRAHHPGDILATLNDVLWTAEPGGEGASAFVGSLEPDTGRLNYATAGSSDAYILRPHGWEPIATDTFPLGRETEWLADVQEQEIHPGDVLLVISDRHLGRHESQLGFNTTSLAETLLRYIHLSARELAEMSVELIARHGTGSWARTITVVKRCDVPHRR